MVKHEVCRLSSLFAGDTNPDLVCERGQTTRCAFLSRERDGLLRGDNGAFSGAV